MMTSAHKKTCKDRPSSGMTLLEIVVALLLIGLLMSFGLVAYNSRANDQNLRMAVIEIEAMASRARTVSFLRQIPYRLSLSSHNNIRLEEPTGTDGYRMLDQVTTDGITLSLRRWGAKDDEWETFDIRDRGSKEPINWYFSPTGICEPISLRLVEGTNWVVLHMDPLTGRVQEEESHIE